MSRKTYGGSNINWGSFDEWSTAISSDSNTSIATAMGNMYPANTSPFSASELANSTIFKGTIQAQTGGTVALTSPYTVSATGGCYHSKKRLLKRLQHYNSSYCYISLDVLSLEIRSRCNRS
jgi:hypothetical protein